MVTVIVTDASRSAVRVTRVTTSVTLAEDVGKGCIGHTYPISVCVALSEEDPVNIVSHPGAFMRCTCGREGPLTKVA